MNQGPPSRLHLRVITSRGLIVEADVDEVSIPSLDGELGVLPGHRPLYTALGSGRLAYSASGRQESLSVGGGYAEVGPDRVTAFIELGKDEKDRS